MTLYYQWHLQGEEIKKAFLCSDFNTKIRNNFIDVATVEKVSFVKDKIPQDKISSAIVVSDEEYPNIYAYLDGTDLIIAPEDDNTKICVESCSNLFTQFKTVKSYDFQNFDTSKATYASSMFNNNSELLDVDVSNFVVDNITNLRNMFNYCQKLQIVRGLEKWNTKKCTDMYGMFATCRVLESVGDISNWDVSNVKQFVNMFKNCAKLKTVDLSKWNTGSATHITSMFLNCYEIESVGDLQNWDTSNVQYMNETFIRTYKLSTIGDVSNWNVSKVTSMKGMFTSSAIKPIPSWYTG